MNSGCSDEVCPDWHIFGSIGLERTDIQREKAAGNAKNCPPADVRRIMDAGNDPDDGQQKAKKSKTTPITGWKPSHNVPIRKMEKT